MGVMGQGVWEGGNRKTIGDSIVFLCTIMFLGLHDYIYIGVFPLQLENAVVS